MRRSLLTAERLCGDCLATAQAAERLGLALSRQDKYTQAQKAYNRAWVLYTKLSGPTHAHTVHLEIDVGTALYEQDKLVDAQRILTSAIATDARTGRAIVGRVPCQDRMSKPW